ncbi:MAG TPA: hypothetical protein VN694_17040 [Caulobacteraceae bacterium]|nr:hypothetical protein [Caulobacteraceae bacterium]
MSEGGAIAARAARRAGLAAALLLSSIGGAAEAARPAHSYLRIDGVLGASNDPNHLGWFDVASWTPGQPTADGRATARITLVGAPPQDLAAAIAAHRTLHEALLQDVRAPDGRLVRNVSFWKFVITGLAPAKTSYAVTLQAAHVVCDDYGPAADGGPCAALKVEPHP